VTAHVDGARTTLEVKGARPLHAFVDDGSVGPRRFLVSFGKTPVADGLPVGAIDDSACARDGRSAGTLVSVHGQALARVLLPALLTPRDLVRMLVDGDKGGDALARLRGVDRFDLAVRAADPGLLFESHLALRPVTD
jgi:hypothetical protein